jgi:hypothetical protein
MSLQTAEKSACWEGGASYARVLLPEHSSIDVAFAQHPAIRTLQPNQQFGIWTVIAPCRSRLQLLPLKEKAYALYLKHSVSRRGVAFRVNPVLNKFACVYGN